MADLSDRKKRFLQNLAAGMEESKALAIYEAEKAAAKGGVAGGLSSLVKAAVGKTDKKKIPVGPAAGIGGDFMKYAVIGIIAIFAVKFLKGK